TIFSNNLLASYQITEVNNNKARIKEEGEEEPGPVVVNNINKEEGEEELLLTNEVIIYNI
ncbi:unnamed protein product, partial [Clonostachys chloroleuca]